jgi:hypothetical protein
MTLANLNSDLFKSYEMVYSETQPPKLVTKSNQNHGYSITPYVPTEADKLNQTFYDGMEGIIHLIQDPLVKSFTILIPKDLANFSEVSKGCYSVTKCELIWLFQLNKLFPNVKHVPKEFCGFNIKKQFEILFKRVQDERKPFIEQYNKNEAELRFLRGPTGFDGEVDRTYKGYRQAVQAYESDDTSLAETKADWKWKEYNAREYHRMMLGGQFYDGTIYTLGANSLQSRLLTEIEHGAPLHFNNQLEFEAAIRASKKAQKKSERANDNSKELFWEEGGISPLWDLGITSAQKFHEKFQEAPDVLSKVGIGSLADLQVLGILKTPPLDEVQIQEESLSEDVQTRQGQICARKELLCSLLDRVSNTLSEAIKKKVDESKNDGITESESSWTDFQKQLDGARQSIGEKCQSPDALVKDCAQIVDEINGLIRKFNRFDQEYQLARLNAYIHQDGIQWLWKALKGHGQHIITLSDYAKADPTSLSPFCIVNRGVEA